jgi:hypothetical protein
MAKTKEDGRSLTVSDTKPDRSTRHRLSDRVPANTDEAAMRSDKIADLRELGFADPVKMTGG